MASAVIGVHCPHAKKRKINKVDVKKRNPIFFQLFIAKPFYSFITFLLSELSLEVYLLFTISFVEFESYFNGKIPVLILKMSQERVQENITIRPERSSPNKSAVNA